LRCQRTAAGLLPEVLFAEVLFFASLPHGSLQVFSSHKPLTTNKVRECQRFNEKPGKYFGKHHWENPNPSSSVTMQKAMIIAQNLSKIFHDKKRGEIRAVDDVSFSVGPGRIYGLLGANGAGKTTTLRMLATLFAPTSGTASVAGFDVVREPEKVRANVGFMATSTALYGRLTARETLVYFGRLNGLADAEIAARIGRLSAELGMEAFLDRRVDKFSTGMKQKVSIARTLIHDPEVMIFDEPTIGLDVMAARSIVRFIRGCRERGKVVVYSTHVMSEVEKLCDRVGIVHGGKLLAEGSVPELRERYGEQDMEEIFVRVVGEGNDDAGNSDATNNGTTNNGAANNDAANNAANERDGVR
jgi:sodium transport system ATP-binding protein